MCQVFEELAEKRAEETRIETLFSSIKNLMKSMKWTAEQAMAAMDISENDQILLKSKFQAGITKKASKISGNTDVTW